MRAIQEPKESFFETSIRVHGIDWVIVFAYFDETGTSGGTERLTAVAGYLFSAAGVTRFKDAYRANVEPLLPIRDGQRVLFHAGPCALGYRPFDGIRESERNHIITQVVAAIRDSVTMGAVVAIAPQDYHDAINGKSGFGFIKNGQEQSIQPLIGSKYSVCLMRCVEAISQWGDKHNIDGDVEYIFEAGSNHETEAAAMMSRLARSTELRRRNRLRGYDFRFKGPDMPWFSAPDLFAWEWQRMDHNAAEPYRGEWRDTMADLVEAKPHVAQYLTPTSLGIQAMVNSFYGVGQL